MADRSTSWRAEDLGHHAQWMRRLARALVRDAATAEDLVQDACVRALAHAPIQVRSLRAWLRQILWNLVRQHYRSEFRRRGREEACTPAEAEAAPDEMSERLESQRMLGEEFPSLREPYRSMLWMRFYENLAPAEIARRTGVPAGTVRWRIKVGLDLLRDRMDKRHRGVRSTWSALLLGWAPRGEAALVGSVRAVPLIPLLLMNTTLKCAIGLAVVLIGAVAFTNLEGLDLFPERTEAVVFEPIPAPSPLLDAVALEQPRALEVPLAAERSAIVPVGEGTTMVSASSDTCVQARFVDEFGRGIEHVLLRDILWNRSGPRTGPSVKSLADGTARMTFPEESSNRERWLDTQLLGFARHEVTVQLIVGETVDLGVIVLRAGGAVSGRVVDSEGRAVAGVRVSRGDPKMTRRNLDARRIWNGPGDFPDTTSDGEGDFVLCGLEAGSLRLWAQLGSGLASYSRPVEVRAGQVSTGVTLVLEDPRAEHIIRGVLLDPDGEAVPNARLLFCFSADEGGVSRQRKWTLADGTFELYMIDDLEWWIRATHPDDAFAPVETAHFKEGTDELIISFEEAHSLDVQVEDARGYAVETFGFRVLRPGTGDEGRDKWDTCYFEAQRFREHGRAQFRIPAEEFWVEVDAPGYDLGFIGPFQPDAVSETLIVALIELPGLSGRVLSSYGPVVGATVSLRQGTRRELMVNGFQSLEEYDDAGRVTTDDSGTFLLTPRQSGEFSIRAEAHGYAPAVWGPVELEHEVGQRGVEIIMGVGGSITGYLDLPGGAHPAGRAIGASRGDGKPIFTKTDAEGAYHFDGLTPGSWEVRYLEQAMAPGSVRLDVSFRDGVVEAIDWSCEVQEGRVTQFDIQPGNEALAPACKLVGEILFNPDAQWIAGLAPSDEVMGHKDISVPANAEGWFEVPAKKPGPYRLNIKNLDAPQFVSAPVELAAGTTSWSLDQIHGALEITGMEPMAEGAELPTLAHIWHGSEGLLIITALVAGEDGVCLADVIPAGEGTLVFPDGENLDPESWEIVQRVTVGAGLTTTVRMP